MMKINQAKKKERISKNSNEKKSFNESEAKKKLQKIIFTLCFMKTIWLVFVTFRVIFKLI
jgi:hypothetical protein